MRPQSIPAWRTRASTTQTRTSAAQASIIGSSSEPAASVSAAAASVARVTGSTDTATLGSEALPPAPARTRTEDGLQSAAWSSLRSEAPSGARRASVTSQPPT